MEIETFELGEFMTNSYVVRASADAKPCLVIDPGYDPNRLIQFLQNNELRIKRILLTHGHCDHIAGLQEVLKLAGEVPIAISQEDALMLTDSQANLSAFMGLPMTVPAADEILEPGQEVILDGIKLQILATPGHTQGGVSFYNAEAGVVFSGDCLFAGSVGRTDFPGGDMTTLIRSITEVLMGLPDDTRVLSGHGPETTIGTERNTNPYIQ